MNFLDQVNLYAQEKKIPQGIADMLHQFYLSYDEAISQNKGDVRRYHPILLQFLDFIVEQIKTPYSFSSFHQSIRSPIDYYQFGIEFIRPLVKMELSSVDSEQRMNEIANHLANEDNVIFLANHQTEPDPQAISLLLEKSHPNIAKEIIFVAGHRVITDPLAVPFSKGRNLLCIFSKNYVEHPPEQKHQKLLHNQRTMKNMKDLLTEGGKCIYVAPSGGRDRINSAGLVEVAPFDPQSIEMFRIIASQSAKTTRFYPMALATYDLLPPPNSIQKNLGERRHASCTPIHMVIGEEVNMHAIPGADHSDKTERRKIRADYIWEQVKESYQKIRGQR